ncbi:MAG: hypothetical protein WA655_03075 [Candidatus Korobacteraceae bacterium]
MENTEIRGPKDTTLNLRQIEAFVVFAAMLLAITLEAACVYWLWLPGTARSLGDTGQPCRPMDAAATLPQCWLLGAVAVLIYRIVLMLVPRGTWDIDDCLHNRRAFVRLWRWVVAVGAVQMCAVYLDRVVTAVQ